MHPAHRTSQMRVRLSVPQALRVKQLQLLECCQSRRRRTGRCLMQWRRKPTRRTSSSRAPLCSTLSKIRLCREPFQMRVDINIILNANTYRTSVLSCMPLQCDQGIISEAVWGYSVWTSPRKAASHSFLGLYSFHACLLTQGALIMHILLLPWPSHVSYILLHQFVLTQKHGLAADCCVCREICLRTDRTVSGRSGGLQCDILSLRLLGCSRLDLHQVSERSNYI